MLAERFSMVARDDDDGVAAIDRGEESRNLRIDVGNFAVVRLRVGRRRRVGGMGIVEVHPGEERPGIGLPQPDQGAVDDLAPPALAVELPAAVVGVARDLVVISLAYPIE